MIRRVCVLAALFTLAAAIISGTTTAADLRPAVQIARQFLETDDDDRRGKLASKLTAYDDDFQEVIRLLQEKEYEPVEPGYLPDENFTAPNLAADRSDDLLFFLIP